MWVLSTDHAELHFFASPEDIPNEYAILSHTWNNKPEDGPLEQSFQEVRKIQKRCARNGRNPRDFVSEKIRRCCELAEKHGYKWVWVDTCCIDKTSSAELSEAINSMFRYYALAAICYGYLQDVNTAFFSLEDLENDRHSRNPYRQERYRSFGSSIWFQRGWTLQELIAPRFFIFLSSSWEIIGTKADFAELLEVHFLIPATVLRFQISHTQFSIAQRMSWFQLRKTTRLEDEAYCLLGLFEIHLPPLYGEGRNAFRRLQEEIMKESADTTLFAWRWSFTDSPERCLLAASPADFEVSWRKDEVVYTPPRRTQVPADTTANVTLALGADLHDMTFAVTPTGIRANIPIFMWRGKTFADLYWSLGDGRRVFLHLEPDPDSEAISSRRTSYRVGEPRQTGDFFLTGDEAYFVRPPDGPPSWKEVLIKHRPRLHRAPGQLPGSTTFRFTPAIPMQLTFDAPVRFPEARIRQFLIQSHSNRFEIRGAGCFSLWTAGPNLPTAYSFLRHVDGRCIIIKVGQCPRVWEWPPRKQRRLQAVWATVTVTDYLNSPWGIDVPLHDCSQDHVLQWPDLRKRFEVPYERETLEVTLSFTPCPLNPKRTLILRASFLLLHVLPDRFVASVQTNLAEQIIVI
ncbi:HET-domain-containing protein [Lentinus brumalis]|uniref:HET-domain-containing protein n=1 Tax=Lentinus brumalis TaxID=2498619 RepID=A0A371CJK0_9APHY|nr:HET-domain-containing protein [Polyporus brumalis]